MGPAGLGPEPQPGEPRLEESSDSKCTSSRWPRQRCACGSTECTTPAASARVSQSVQVMASASGPRLFGSDSTIAQYSFTTFRRSNCDESRRRPWASWPRSRRPRSAGRAGGRSRDIHGRPGAVLGNWPMRFCAPAREKAAGKSAARHENCFGAEKYFTIIICSPIITW